VKVRFQADADLNHIIVLAVLRRESSVDFKSATGAGLSGRADEEVLALAAREGRVLVSHDHRTMPKHFARFSVEQSSPGLLIVPQHLVRQK
jgi:predicted nuclease of predicted toxin-antitoxin system